MINCRIYAASPMTGYDKADMYKRAKYLQSLARQYGLTLISPVLEEQVENKSGPLINDNEGRLKGFWQRDKAIIRNRDGKGAHVVLLDNAHMKSFGCEREYALNRFALWKPTILLMPNKGLNVSQFEDDYVTSDEYIAFMFIQKKFGTWGRRFKWRVGMLVRSLPMWIWDQINAFR